METQPNTASGSVIIISEDRQDFIGGGHGDGQNNEPSYYTTEEIDTLNPEAIEIDRVDPAARPIVEKAIRDYKELQGDYTRKSQELSELKKSRQPENETHFPEDPQKDQVFKNYLGNPLSVIRDINSQIAQLESIIPDDGYDEYKQARRQIAYWQGIKDEFSAKRAEISERNRQTEINDAKIAAELGEDAGALIDYAKLLGFSERDFKTRQGVREGVRKLWKAANAGTTAAGKEVKPKPQSSAKPSGQTDGGAGGSGKTEEEILMDPNTPTDVRMALWKKRKG